MNLIGIVKTLFTGGAIVSSAGGSTPVPTQNEPPYYTLGIQGYN